MRGRLLPARGGPGSPLTIREVVKAAQAKAHRDASVRLIRETFSGLVKQAEGETGAALRSTIGSAAGPELALEEADQVADTEVEDYGTSPSQKAEAVPPAPGRASWAPVRADKASIGLHEDQEKLSAVLSSLFSGELEGLSELEKQAYLGRLLRAGRGLAGRLAARGGATGRVGRLLQRDVRSPLQVARTGKGGLHVQARSPLAPSKTPPPIPRDAGAYRTAAKPPAAAPKRSAARKVEDKVKSLGKPEGTVGKPKSLTGALLPYALGGGALYGLYKGVPAAVNWASRAANQPMAYNFGHQQYQYGYTPQGQAQF
jgi:hypothetical protein